MMSQPPGVCWWLCQTSLIGDAARSSTRLMLQKLSLSDLRKIEPVLMSHAAPFCTGDWCLLLQAGVQSNLLVDKVMTA